MILVKISLLGFSGSSKIFIYLFIYLFYYFIIFLFIYIFIRTKMYMPML